jgi:hypothetical protein
MRELKHEILARCARFFPGVCAAILALAPFCSGRASAEETMPLIRLVDMHTAGVIPKGYLAVESRLYEGLGQGTGFLFSVAVGITDRFSLGLGYGAEGLLGRNRDPQFNPFPGCMVKYRLLDESFVLPGMSIGFDYQGFGGIADQGLFGYRGYIYKSQGFFAALSKSYLLFKTLEFGFHGDVNWSLEEAEKVGWPDLWVGFDLGISRSFSFAVEYDFGLNTKDPYGGVHAYALPQDGYLNAGLRWNFTSNFAIEFDARDILENRMYLTNPYDPHSERKLGWSRELKVVYMAPIR